MLQSLARFAKRKLWPRSDYVLYQDSILPAPDMRWCGPKFKDDQFYVRSAENEAQRLVTHFGCNRASRILDVGCGQGRLAIGLLRVIGELPYLGLDVDRRSIQWCRQHITRAHPSYRFNHLNIANERYNPSGVELRSGFRFDLDASSIDIIYLYSVFSHTSEQDMCVYLSEFARILAQDGRVFFTTWVEENVPDFAANPPNYVFNHCSGPLHVVRYERRYLFALLHRYGFAVDDFTHRTEADSQSALYLHKLP
jgi:SAM-dependent methyltransferase